MIYKHHESLTEQGSAPSEEMVDTLHRPDAGTISRRTLIMGGAVALLAVTVGRSCSGDSNSLDKRDILIDPDKFQMFVDSYLQTAEQLAEDPKKPLPYEVFLAVGIHESDSGTSELAIKANNMHGIVAKDEWTGAIYEKSTEEVVSKDSVGDLAVTHGSKLEILHTNSDGTIRVKYPRPFRKYTSPEGSFADFQNKVYFANEDGTFRYADVVEYLEEGGRDPYKVVELMSDSDQDGEARYATGQEWLKGVQTYIKQIQSYTGNESTGLEPPEGTPDGEIPDRQPEIDMGKIDFSDFDQPRDKELIETMKDAISSLRAEDFIKFKESGIIDKSALVKKIVGQANYDKWYNSDSITVEYIIWHLWATGVTSSGDPETAPAGTSHNIPLESLVVSWKNNSKSSTQFALGDEERNHELWQLSDNPATIAGHIRDGVMDLGQTGREDVSNRNSVGIEVQADSVYDVDSTQFKTMLLWATHQLLEHGLIQQGMIREDTDKIVNQSVIGHGKNDGLEFGYKYTRPLIDALKQYVFIAIQA